MTKNRIPLDSYEMIPEEQRAYLMNYGKNFNEKMCRFAVSMMRDRKGNKVEMVKKDDLEKKLKENKIEIENDVMYNGVYVYAMCMADFMGSSIEDEKHALLYVKDYIDDPDAADGQVFNRFFADCVNAGIPIDWAEMI
jgi:hypothetical protein